MAEKTLYEERMSRADVATQLRRLADELDADEGDEDGDIEVPVGTKRVRLTPPRRSASARASRSSWATARPSP